MLSCQRSTMLAAAAQNTCPFLHRFKSHRSRFRCLLDQIAVSPSFTSVLTSDNVISAAAKAATTSASLHGAVSSAITQVAVTAVAIASGACLSTKVDFLWPKLDEQPGIIMLDGVDVTGYPIFNDAKAGTEGYSFCKESTPWPNAKDRRPLFNTLYTYRKNIGNVGSIKW